MNQELTSVISAEDIDIIGEIANISIGACATTLSQLTGVPVRVDTPKVFLDTKESLLRVSEDSCIFIDINYVEGLSGSNTLLLQERAVKYITDLCTTKNGECMREELEEMHLSTISEVMNQMMGNAVTSLSTMLDRKITITPPVVSLFTLEDLLNIDDFLGYLGDRFITVAMCITIGEDFHSQLMQSYPLNMVHEICMLFKNAKGYEKKSLRLN